MSSTKSFILRGLGFLPTKHPSTTRVLTLANAVTAIGLLASLLYGALVLLKGTEASAYTCFALVCVAVVSDVLDGFLARAMNQCTRLGSIIDPWRDRVLGLVVVIHMVTTISSASTALIGGAIVIVELLTAFTNANNPPRHVHTLGKVRMGVHAGAAVLFLTTPILTEYSNVPFQTPVVGTDTLLILMLIASILAFASYAFHWERGSRDAA